MIDLNTVDAKVVINYSERCFTKRTPHARPPKSPPGSDGMVPSATVWVICSQRVPFRRRRWWWEWTARFLSLVTLTFDIQTRPSDGPKTSLRIWRQSIQPFRRYLSDKQKSFHRQC